VRISNQEMIGCIAEMIGLRLKRISSVCRLQVISYKKTIAVWYANAILPSGYAAALKFDGKKKLRLRI